MKKTLSKFIIITVLLILGVGGLYNQDKIYRVIYPSFCDEQIHFKINRVDGNFGLTKANFIGHTLQGAKIWNEAYGEKVFVYDPTGALTINLIFDARQRLTNQINQLSTKISTAEDNLKPGIARHQEEVAAFQKKMAAFNAQVSDWNSRGGAPEDDYTKLLSEQSALKTEAEKLNARAQELNQSAVVFNSEIANYNSTVSEFNSTLKERPEEGLFDGKNNTISIYFYITNEELVHTLAHEFGHALGMGHLDNPDAIMFSKTNSKTAPTPDDLQELHSVCKRSPVWELLRDRYLEPSK